MNLLRSTHLFSYSSLMRYKRQMNFKTHHYSIGFYYSITLSALEYQAGRLTLGSIAFSLLNKASLNTYL